jgi:hypothetical protein
MAKAKADAYKDWVRAVVPKLREYFYLEAWHIDLVWEDDDEVIDGRSGTVMHISINGDYLQAVLHMMPAARTMFDDADIEKLAFCLVHEFSHILTEPLYDIARGAVPAASSDFLQTIREQQTQRIALAVFRGIPEELYSL